MPSVSLVRVLRQYGHALGTLQHSLGREDLLPCGKEALRECLLVALAIADDENTRERLREGYVLLEAFVPRRDYEAVRRFENTARRLRRPAGGISSQALLELIHVASDANVRATAIEARVAGHMRARRREIAGG
jgi:hypothetical protein